MSGNTLGTLFCVTSFGESHGPAIGCVVDGCPPGLALDAADIQRDLDRRKPGTSRHVTQRRESTRSRSCRAYSKGAPPARRSRC
jgi:chorismate synthase